jgi:hypothetical protein
MYVASETTAVTRGLRQDASARKVEDLVNVLEIDSIFTCEVSRVRKVPRPSAHSAGRGVNEPAGAFV